MSDAAAPRPCYRGPLCVREVRGLTLVTDQGEIRLKPQRIDPPVKLYRGDEFKISYIVGTEEECT